MRVIRLTFTVLACLAVAGAALFLTREHWLAWIGVQHADIHKDDEKPAPRSERPRHSRSAPRAQEPRPGREAPGLGRLLADHPRAGRDRGSAGAFGSRRHGARGGDGRQDSCVSRRHREARRAAVHLAPGERVSAEHPVRAFQGDARAAARPGEAGHASGAGQDRQRAGAHEDRRSEPGEAIQDRHPGLSARPADPWADAGGSSPGWHRENLSPRSRWSPPSRCRAIGS